MPQQQVMTDDQAKQAALSLILARLDPAALPAGQVITAFRLSADGTATVHIFTGQKFTFTNEELVRAHEALHPPKPATPPRAQRGQAWTEEK